MSKTGKKRYLKELNRCLKKETAGKFDTSFVFYPPGSKPKDAEGVTASGPADAETLAIMQNVQARVFAQFEKAARTP